MPRRLSASLKQIHKSRYVVRELDLGGAVVPGVEIEGEWEPMVSMPISEHSELVSDLHEAQEKLDAIKRLLNTFRAGNKPQPKDLSTEERARLRRAAVNSGVYEYGTAVDRTLEWVDATTEVMAEQAAQIFLDGQKLAYIRKLVESVNNSDQVEQAMPYAFDQITELVKEDV